MPTESGKYKGKYRPESYGLAVMIDRELHTLAKSQAAKEHRSMKSLVETYIRQGLTKDAALAARQEKNKEVGE